MKRAATILSLLLAVSAHAQSSDERTEASAHVTRVEQLINDWDIEAAAAELEALGKVIPQDAEPMKFYRARIAFELGRYEEAVKLFKEAGVEEDPRSYLKLAQDTLDVVKGHQKLESENFIFYFPPGKDAVLAPYALETLEATRKALLEDLGYAPPGKVRVEVVNNAAELAKVSTLTKAQINTTGTIAICKFNKLMITSPKAVVYGYDWLDTLAHEYIHLVVSRKSHNTVPIWLHEGLAKYLESRWRGKPGMALSPATQALLGRRVKENKLIPFEKMHPSIALLPSAEDAATAFAEVFYAIDYVHQKWGTQGLRTIIDQLREGKTDKQAVEAATGQSFAAFEKAWLSHVKKQEFPRELLPLEDKKVLKENTAKKKDEKKGKEISFGDFAEVQEVPARKFAHLGELLREKNRPKAAAIEYGKAHKIVGDKYQAVSNKYALALLEIGALQEAERVLLGSLRVHPGVASTNVHLGRIYLARKDFSKGYSAFMEALAVDPFDPEIHLALAYIHGEMGNPKMLARTKSAASVLTGMPEERVLEAAKRYAESKQLADKDVPQTATPKDAPASEETARPGVHVGEPAPPAH